MKKKVLFLFPEGNLPYSPTTLNLLRLFSNHYDVSIAAKVWSEEWKIDTSFYHLIRLNDNFVGIRSIYSRAIKKIKTKFFLLNKFQKIATSQEYRDFQKIKGIIRITKPDLLIAVDLFALYCCYDLNMACTFLSFEIPGDRKYYDALSHQKIDKVIIQSIDRYNHLFGDLGRKPEYFILPNAPNFRMPEKRSVASKNLVYNGNVWSAFGAQFCMSFVSKYPEYSLHVKGSVTDDMINIYFPYLLNTGVLKFDKNYLNDEELKRYLLEFSIGFCFYNFEHPFIKKNSFNYETGPAGKLYNYMSVGIPVICSSIPAFKIVEENFAGVLIEDYSPDTIKLAVDKILGNYKFYSDNALELAKKSSFDTNSQSIIDSYKYAEGSTKIIA